MLCIWVALLLVYKETAITVQKYWIPCILVLCLVECGLNFADLEVFNLVGKRNIWACLTAILLKAVRDSICRTLLLSAAKGWGITKPSLGSARPRIIAIGTFYFFFSLLYETAVKTTGVRETALLTMLSFPLILLNTLIFYCVYSWLIKSFSKLTNQGQLYKLKLLTQFGWVLGISGTVCVLWTVTESLVRLLFHFEQVWMWHWLFIGVWDVIFFLGVLSVMVVWRLNSHSKMLAYIEEIQDSELSHEEEEKSIEMVSRP